MASGKERPARLSAGNSGLTLVELVTSMTIMILLASAILPISRLTIKRNKEIELRESLREIRTAINDYHSAVMKGRMRKEGLASEGYPTNLKMLVEGVSSNVPGVKAKFLRRIPKDPFNYAQEEFDEEGWRIRSVQDVKKMRETMFWGRENVFDVASGSESRAVDGSYYKDW